MTVSCGGLFSSPSSPPSPLPPLLGSGVGVGVIVGSCVAKMVVLGSRNVYDVVMTMLPPPPLPMVMVVWAVLVSIGESGMALSRGSSGVPGRHCEYQGLRGGCCQLRPGVGKRGGVGPVCCAANLLSIAAVVARGTSGGTRIGRSATCVWSLGLVCFPSWQGCVGASCLRTLAPDGDGFLCSCDRCQQQQVKNGCWWCHGGVGGRIVVGGGGRLFDQKRKEKIKIKSTSVFCVEMG